MVGKVRLASALFAAAYTVLYCVYTLGWKRPNYKTLDSNWSPNFHTQGWRVTAECVRRTREFTSSSPQNTVDKVYPLIRQKTRQLFLPLIQRVWFGSMPTPPSSELTRRHTGDSEKARSRVIWPQEILVLCKSFNTLCFDPFSKWIMVWERRKFKYWQNHEMCVAKQLGYWAREMGLGGVTYYENIKLLYSTLYPLCLLLYICWNTSEKTIK